MRTKWLFLWVCCCQVVNAESFYARATHVSDGDTLWVQVAPTDAPRKLRLLGIDAPELCQSGGAQARVALWQLVRGQLLRVTVKFQDDYGRGLARVEVAQQDVAAAMVSSGNAWSSRWQRQLGPYAQQEAQARAAGLGLFAQPEPQWPGDFRKRHGSCYPSDSP